MKDAMKELETAYALLDSITIRGDSCDMMTAARQHLRAAFSILKEAKQEDKDG